MKKVKYIKPSGVEIDVNDNDATKEYAKLNGWKKPRLVIKDQSDKEKLLDKLI